MSRIIPATAGSSTRTSPSVQPAGGLTSEIYRFTLADLQSASVDRDGNYLTQSTGLAAGTVGDIALTQRNTVAAAGQGWGEFTVLHHPLLNFLPNCPIDVKNGGSGNPCILWAKTELVSFAAADDNMILACGIFERNGIPGATNALLGAGIRTFSAGTAARAYLPLGGTASQGASFAVSTAGVPSSISECWISTPVDGASLTEFLTKNLGYQTGLDFNAGGSLSTRNIVGAAANDMVIAVGIGQESTVDEGNRTVECNFEVGWMEIPSEFYGFV